MRSFVRRPSRTGGTRAAEIVEATSGFDALRLLPRGPYDLVITDINMPDINGLELVQFIRKSEHHRSTPLIIISTQSSERDRERGLSLGADGYLAKPFTPKRFSRPATTLSEPSSSRVNPWPTWATRRATSSSPKRRRSSKVCRATCSARQLARQRPVDPELVNDVFRAVHTLKGLAGLFGAARMGALSHELEDLLDDLRLGRIELTRPCSTCCSAPSALRPHPRGRERTAHDPLDRHRRVLCASSPTCRSRSRTRRPSRRVLRARSGAARPCSPNTKSTGFAPTSSRG